MHPFCCQAPAPGRGRWGVGWVSRLLLCLSYLELAYCAFDCPLPFVSWFGHEWVLNRVDTPGSASPLGTITDLSRRLRLPRPGLGIPTTRHLWSMSSIGGRGSRQGAVVMDRTRTGGQSSRLRWLENVSQSGPHEVFFRKIVSPTRRYLDWSARHGDSLDPHLLVPRPSFAGTSAIYIFNLSAVPRPLFVGYP